MIFLAAILIALSFSSMVFLLLMYFKRSQSLDIFHRMRRHNTKQLVTKKEDVREEILLRLYKFVQRISKPLVERNFAQSLEYKLRQAGLPLLGGEYIVIVLMSSTVIGFLVFLVTLSPVFALIGAVLVPLFYWAVIMTLIARRLKAFTEQLGDCLITISNALRAGYSFQQTVEIISSEMEPPIGEEFSRMNHDIFMGVPLEEALDTANKRIGSSDFELVVTAVLIQREVGGNLAQILDNISYTIMERIRMKREILSLTAQGRMSALVLLVLPFVAGAAMYFMNHDNFVAMFDEPIGQMAVGICIVLEIIGYFIIRRIVDIDV